MNRSQEMNENEKEILPKVEMNEAILPKTEKLTQNIPNVKDTVQNSEQLKNTVSLTSHDRKDNRMSTNDPKCLDMSLKNNETPAKGQEVSDFNRIELAPPKSLADLIGLWENWNHANKHYYSIFDPTKYEVLAKIGQGTFGEVYKTRNIENNSLLALKKIPIRKTVNELAVIREVQLLRFLRHPNVIDFHEVFVKEKKPHQLTYQTFFLIFELCDHDLNGLLNSQQIIFKLGEIKYIVLELLKGLNYIHNKNIFHRDLKPANVFLTQGGEVKIGDFGLSRPFASHRATCRFSTPVVTLWYRAPELMLCHKNYSKSIDMWAFGCIMGEMWKRVPLFQGTSEFQQLNLILEMCGNVSNENLPPLSSLQIYKKLVSKIDKPRIGCLQLFINDSDALDLVDKCLNLNPNLRIDAQTALKHDFFTKGAIPINIKHTLSKSNHNMFAYTNSYLYE